MTKTELKDFQTLKKGDLVVVEWRWDSFKGNKRTKFAAYNIIENKSQETEIILQRKNNVYFNYSMFLNPEVNGVSNCKRSEDGSTLT